MYSVCPFSCQYLTTTSELPCSTVFWLDVHKGHLTSLQKPKRYFSGFKLGTKKLLIPLQFCHTDSSCSPLFIMHSYLNCAVLLHIWSSIDQSHTCLFYYWDMMSCNLSLVHVSVFTKLLQCELQLLTKWWTWSPANASHQDMSFSCLFLHANN